MRITADRILTTHSGSLPRPKELVDIVLAVEAGETVDAAELAQRIAAGVDETVRKEREAHVDILNDGEVSKPSYATYVKDRLTGLGGEFPQTLTESESADLGEFPDFAEIAAATQEPTTKLHWVSCDGPVSYVGQEALQTDIDTLKAAAGASDAAGLFMSAASPGVIALFSPNQYYPSEDEYQDALAEAMRVEYEAIHEAGLLLQLDCPDFAWAATEDEDDIPGFIKKLERRIEVLNHAVRNIPADDMRIHVCWGNGEWPRNHDVELKDIIGTLVNAKPAGLMVMGANGRHAHEWQVFKEFKLPDGKYMLPGVIDVTTNTIEHPETVAMRLEQYASVVGRENVTAATDCGFGTVAGMQRVAPTIVWAKLQAMADGAKLASERLWA